MTGKLYSLDFHMGYCANEANSGPVQAGQSKTWTIHNPAPGAWFYQCSADALNGIWEHISNGKYGDTTLHGIRAAVQYRGQRIIQGYKRYTRVI
jgi:hypothetical protein